VRHKARTRIDKSARSKAKNHIEDARRFRRDMRKATADDLKQHFAERCREKIDAAKEARRKVFVHEPAYIGRTIALGLDAQLKMDALVPPAVVECRIVKFGSGPDAGVDIENLPALAGAAE
jgi:hypothetical protein